MRKTKNLAGNNSSSFAKLMASSGLDAFIIIIILFNCVLMALTPPSGTIPTYIYICNWIFNVVYVLEVTLKMLAFGLVKYFSETFHYLDVAVSASSLIEILISVINGIALALNRSSPVSSVKVLSFIRILRILRVLRPLKALTFLPSVLTYVEALFMSVEDIMLNALFLIVSSLGLGMLFFGLIYDQLSYRCVPTDFTDSNVLSNSYYVDYGVAYFYSPFNVDYCGYKTCASGFSCVNTHLGFRGVFGDFGTPWHSFVTSWSFITLRGWPDIFWAISDSKGPGYALLVLFLTAFLCYFLIVNLFPAIFIVSLKKGEEKQKKIQWLTAFPGNINQITELELMMWGRRRDSANNNNNNNKEKGASSLGEKYYSRQKQGLCRPSCKGCSTLQEFFCNDQSSYSKFLILIVLLNIFILALSYPNSPTWLNSLVYYTNLVLLGIFVFDVVIKIILMGPIDYFWNFYNLLDFSVTLLGIISISNSIPAFTVNFRAIRLIRLSRFARAHAVSSVIYDRSGNEYRDPSLSVGRLLSLAEKLSTPMFNVTLLFVLVLFIFSVVGTEYFYNDTPSTLSNMASLIFAGASSNSTAVEVVAFLWSGSTLTRLSFVDFASSFVTLFNVLVLNSWYYIMIITVYLSNSAAAPWFFLFFIVISNYFLISTLTASLSTLLENQALLALTEVAKDNRVLIESLMSIHNRFKVKSAFEKMKSLMNDGDGKKAGNIGGNRADAVILDHVSETDEHPSFWDQFYEKRVDYSLFLFSPDGVFRQTVTWIVDSFFFQILVSCAVLLAVFSVLTSNGVFSSSEWNYINFYVPIIFLAEMVMQWISLSVFIGPHAYMKSMLNIVDFVVNISLLVGFAISSSGFNHFRIIRIIKIPLLLQFFAKKSSFAVVVETYKKSYYSFVSLGLIVGFIIVFFAVISLQLWQSELGYCSYSGYPEGRSRYMNDTSFPNGCSGSVYVTSGNYTELISLEWKTPLDNFDSIFTACRSVVKVFFMNNWAPILFNTMDSVGVNYEPQTNHSSASFIFFFFLSLFSITFGVLVLSILYYHYLLEIYSDGKRILLGEEDALWCMFRQKLQYVQMKMGSVIPSRDKRFRREAYFITRSWWYCSFAIAFSCIPFILFFGYYDRTYAQNYFLQIDGIFSLIYLIEFLFRFLISESGFFATFNGKQEVFVVIILCIEVLLTLLSFSGNSTRLSRIFMYLGIFCRFYRVAIVFPVVSVFLLVLGQSLVGFIPSVLNIFFVILIFGALAKILFGNISIDYGNEFLTSHYNFSSFYKAWITMFAMGTGNVWTEVIYGLKISQGIGAQIFIEIFFGIYYLVFFSLMKTFGIMILTKFLNFSGATLGLAEEQIHNFRNCWKATTSNSYDIDFKTLMKLVQCMKAPLGLRNSSDYTYVGKYRFAKKIVLCMHFDDDKEMSFDDMMKKRYRFQQVLAGAFKRALLSFELPDENTFRLQRKIQQERLSKLRVRLGRLLVAKVSKKYEDKCASSLLMMQRLDPQIHKSSYVRLVNQLLDIFTKRINSFGFEGLDGLALTCLLQVSRNENNASSLQLAVRSSLNIAGLASDKYEKMHVESVRFHAQTKSILNRVQEVYDNHIQRLWNPRSLTKVSSVQVASDVSFVTFDSKNTIFVGFQSGIVKIWANKLGGGSISEESKFFLIQELKYDFPIASIVVSRDTMYIAIATGKAVVLLYAKGRSKRKGSMIEKYRFVDHESDVLSVLMYGKFLICGCEDGTVYLWSQSNHSILRTYCADSSILSMIQMPLMDRVSSLDDPQITDILIIGCESGSLVMLDLPLITSAVSSSSESSSWSAKVFESEIKSKVLSLCVAYGFLFAGFADGSVRAWSLSVTFSSSTPSVALWVLGSSLLDNVYLVRVSTEFVHSGPVTSLCYTGNCLFSSSIDMSIVSWLAPLNLAAKTAAEFSQTFLPGYVPHPCPIIGMSYNNYGLLSVDESGMIMISSPNESGELISSNQDRGFRPYIFSFLEHDFGDCFICHKGTTLEEECELVIENFSEAPLTLRNLLFRSQYFRIEMNEIENLKLGSKLVSVLNKSGNTKRALEIEANGMAKFRVFFSPYEEKHFYQNIDFIVNECDIVTVRFCGKGIKPSLVVGNGRKIYDFGTCDVGDSIALSITFSNHSALPSPLSLLDDTFLDESNVSCTLRDKNIYIEPASIFLDARQSASLTVRFIPQCAMPSFECSLKFMFAGALYSVAKLRGRAQIPRIQPSQALLLGEDAAGAMNGGPPIVPASPLRYERAVKNLRALATCESIPSTNIVNYLLLANGWTKKVLYDSVLFRHKSLGHIELLKPNVKRSNDIETLNISFFSKTDAFYEVWFCEHLIHSGSFLVSSSSECIIHIAMEDLTKVTEQISAESFGSLTVELMIYHPQEGKGHGDMRISHYNERLGVLKSIVSIEVICGVRLSFDSNDNFKLSSSFDVLGISHVITFLPDGRGCIRESFSRGVDLLREEKYLPFIQVFLHATSSLSKFKIEDQVYEELSSDKAQTLMDSSSSIYQDIKTGIFAHETALNVINIEPPVISPFPESTSVVYRKLNFEFFAPFLKDTLVSQALHSYSAFVAQVDREFQADDLPRYPQKIRGFTETIEISYSQRTALYRRLVMEEDKASPIDAKKTDPGLLDGKWMFVLDSRSSNVLNLVSTHAQDFAKNVEAVTISFRCEGMVLSRNQNTILFASYGQITRGITPTWRDNLVRMANYRGRSSHLNTPPRFLSSIWEDLCKYEKVEALKASFKKLTIQQQNEKRKIALAKSSEIMEDFKHRMSKAKKNSLEVEMERKDMEKKAAKLLDECSSRQTYSDVYFELAFATHAYLTQTGPTHKASNTAAPKATGTSTTGVVFAKRINIPCLCQYLSSGAATSFERPLSMVELSFLLQDLGRNEEGDVSLQQFKLWYDTNNYTTLLESLADSKVYTFMLDEELSKEKGVKVGAGNIVKRIEEEVVEVDKEKRTSKGFFGLFGRKKNKKSKKNKRDHSKNHDKDQDEEKNEGSDHDQGGHDNSDVRESENSTYSNGAMKFLNRMSRGRKKNRNTSDSNDPMSSSQLLDSSSGHGDRHPSSISDPSLSGIELVPKASESSDDSKSVGHGESDDEYAAFLDRDNPNDDGIQASRGISEVSVISSITAASQ